MSWRKGQWGPEFGLGDVGSARGDGRYAQGQYGDQRVHSGSVGFVLAAWDRWMLRRVSIGDVGFCLDSWFSFSFLLSLG